MKLIKRIGCCALALALCVAAFGCSKKPDTISPDDITDDIEYAGLHTFPPQPTTYTPVYASAFGDTIILATVPVEEWHSQESDCPPREISNGGRVKCNGLHESEVPITQVIILEDLIPRVCSGWFRDMIHLENIQGLDKLHMHHVTDTSYMFAGCEKLPTLDLSSWDVSKVTDMTCMFKDCYSMNTLPKWYQETE